MTMPSVAKQLVAMTGTATAKPVKAERAAPTGMRRSPMRRRPALGWGEDTFYLEDIHGRRWLWPNHWMSEKDLEDTLVDWAFKLGNCIRTWHVYSPERSDAGFWDRVWLFPGRALFTEQKVRDRKGVANTLSVEQKGFLYDGIAAGLDCRTWCFPDDCEEAWVTLTGREWALCPYAKEVTP